MPCRFFQRSKNPSLALKSGIPSNSANFIAFKWSISPLIGRLVAVVVTNHWCNASSTLSSLLLDVAFLNLTRNQQNNIYWNPIYSKQIQNWNWSFFEQHNLFIKINKFFIYAFKINFHEFHIIKQSIFYNLKFYEINNQTA